MLLQILQDALFAAVAAIGFAAISRPPVRIFWVCALLAAISHSMRFLLMQPDFLGVHIVVATLLASFTVGTIAVFISPVVRTPAEAFLYPALLPMIPGVYAYKSFGGLAMAMLADNASDYDRYFYMFSSNGIICLFIITMMVAGATLPIFMFKGVSFSSTRND